MARILSILSNVNPRAADIVDALDGAGYPRCFSRPVGKSIAAVDIESRRSCLRGTGRRPVPSHGVSRTFVIPPD
jgi:hypothetical protein